MEQIADDFKSKNQPPTGALLAAEVGAILQDPGMYRLNVGLIYVLMLLLQIWSSRPRNRSGMV